MHCLYRLMCIYLREKGASIATYSIENHLLPYNNIHFYKMQKYKKTVIAKKIFYIYKKKKNRCLIDPSVFLKRRKEPFRPDFYFCNRKGERRVLEKKSRKKEHGKYVADQISTFAIETRRKKVS